MQSAKANTDTAFSNYADDFQPEEDRNQTGTNTVEDRNQNGTSPEADRNQPSSQAAPTLQPDKSPKTTSIIGFEDFFQSNCERAEGRNQAGTTLEAALSLKEAVDFYKISEKTIRLHISQGKIDGRKEQGPRGLEWRIYPNGFPKANINSEVTEQIEAGHCQAENTPAEDRNQPGNITEPDWNQTGNEVIETTTKGIELDKLIEIIQLQSQKLEDANKRLESANYRIGYLEAQTSNYQEQVKLLTDSQHKGWWNRFCSWFIGR
ncbi:MAG: helix-turn-helix domain-containing protein [Candidatus Obscuribacterales bacterium]|nr:helix-turn-helix domain-containing protein [Candidatus Obscuribacterales bacterium]